MWSEVTADVVEGQIVTATGLLQWIQAEAEKTGRALRVSPLLAALRYLLASILRKMEQIGIDHFDPEHAGFAASKFIEVSETIRVMIARSDQRGLYDRFPSNKLLRKIQAQGKKLAHIANGLNVVDDQWRATIAKTAQERIKLAHQIALSTPEEPIELFDSPEEPYESPSEEAIRAQFHRTATLHKK